MLVEREPDAYCHHALVPGLRRGYRAQRCQGSAATSPYANSAGRFESSRRVALVNLEPQRLLSTVTLGASREGWAPREYPMARSPRGVDAMSVGEQSKPESSELGEFLKRIQAGDEGAACELLQRFAGADQ